MFFFHRVGIRRMTVDPNVNLGLLFDSRADMLSWNFDKGNSRTVVPNPGGVFPVSKNIRKSSKPTTSLDTLSKNPTSPGLDR
ncbi:hypothetical protein AYI69_g8710 [Smittium culicis]|uniref:Uncharacterized protein n=1 Tax=Smittium culicis TaxID=133412 RepID=A0A1R1XHV9_9FUNG|nr:hypothetical protein AYI69_g8710 [Smittium culicis]